PEGTPLLIPTYGPELRLLRAQTRSSDPARNLLLYLLKEVPIGGSGAPCLDSELNVVAMQQAFRPGGSSGTECQAIAIGAIVRDLAGKGFEPFAPAAARTSETGDALFARGELEPALQAFRAALASAEPSRGDDPGAMRDLARLHGRIGK